jgi:hypothetical protein
MSGEPPVSRINGAKPAITPTTEDVTMIHAILPETFLRHHAQQTARIVERSALRRLAVSRRQRGPRTRATVGV